MQHKSEHNYKQYKYKQQKQRILTQPIMEQLRYKLQGLSALKHLIDNIHTVVDMGQQLQMEYSQQQLGGVVGSLDKTDIMMQSLINDNMLQQLASQHRHNGESHNGHNGESHNGESHIGDSTQYVMCFNVGQFDVGQFFNNLKSSLKTTNLLYPINQSIHQLIHNYYTNTTTNTNNTTNTNTNTNDNTNTNTNSNYNDNSKVVQIHKIRPFTFVSVALPRHPHTLTQCLSFYLHTHRILSTIKKMRILIFINCQQLTQTTQSKTNAQTICRLKMQLQHVFVCLQSIKASQVVDCSTVVLNADTDKRGLCKMLGGFGDAGGSEGMGTVDYLFKSIISTINNGVHPQLHQLALLRKTLPKQFHKSFTQSLTSQPLVHMPTPLPPFTLPTALHQHLLKQPSRLYNTINNILASCQFRQALMLLRYIGYLAMCFGVGVDMLGVAIETVLKAVYKMRSHMGMGIASTQRIRQLAVVQHGDDYVLKATRICQLVQTLAHQSYTKFITNLYNTLTSNITDINQPQANLLLNPCIASLPSQLPSLSPIRHNLTQTQVLPHLKHTLTQIYTNLSHNTMTAAIPHIKYTLSHGIQQIYWEYFRVKMKMVEEVVCEGFVCWMTGRFVGNARRGYLGSREVQQEVQECRRIREAGIGCLDEFVEQIQGKLVQIKEQYEQAQREQEQNTIQKQKQKQQQKQKQKEPSKLAGEQQRQVIQTSSRIGRYQPMQQKQDRHIVMQSKVQPQIYNNKQIVQQWDSMKHRLKIAEQYKKQATKQATDKYVQTKHEHESQHIQTYSQIIAQPSNQTVTYSQAEIQTNAQPHIEKHDGIQASTQVNLTHQSTQTIPQIQAVIQRHQSMQNIQGSVEQAGQAKFIADSGGKLQEPVQVKQLDADMVELIQNTGIRQIRQHKKYIRHITNYITSIQHNCKHQHQTEAALLIFQQVVQLYRHKLTHELRNNNESILIGQSQQIQRLSDMLAEYAELEYWHEYQQNFITTKLTNKLMLFLQNQNRIQCNEIIIKSAKQQMVKQYKQSIKIRQTQWLQRKKIKSQKFINQIKSKLNGIKTRQNTVNSPIQTVKCRKAQPSIKTQRQRQRQRQRQIYEQRQQRQEQRQGQINKQVERQQQMQQNKMQINNEMACIVQRMQQLIQNEDTKTEQLQEQVSKVKNKLKLIKQKRKQKSQAEPIKQKNKIHNQQTSRLAYTQTTSSRLAYTLTTSSGLAYTQTTSASQLNISAQGSSAHSQILALHQLQCEQRMQQSEQLKQESQLNIMQDIDQIKRQFTKIWMEIIDEEIQQLRLENARKDLEKLMEINRILMMQALTKDIEKSEIRIRKELQQEQRRQKQQREKDAHKEGQQKPLQRQNTQIVWPCQQTEPVKKEDAGIDSTFSTYYTNTAISNQQNEVAELTKYKGQEVEVQNEVERHQLIKQQEDRQQANVNKFNQEQNRQEQNRQQQSKQEQSQQQIQNIVQIKDNANYSQNHQVHGGEQ